MQGVVILEATINESGAVSDVRVLRSIPLLDQAAIDAVRQWQYEPTLVDGAAVPVLVTVTVNFSLAESVRLRIVLPNGATPVLKIQMGGFGSVTLSPAEPQRFSFRPSRPPGGEVGTGIHLPGRRTGS